MSELFENYGDLAKVERSAFKMTGRVSLGSSDYSSSELMLVKCMDYRCWAVEGYAVTGDGPDLGRDRDLVLRAERALAFGHFKAVLLLAHDDCGATKDAMRNPSASDSDISKWSVVRHEENLRVMLHSWKIRYAVSEKGVKVFSAYLAHDKAGEWNQLCKLQELTPLFANCDSLCKSTSGFRCNPESFLFERN